MSTKCLAVALLPALIALGGGAAAPAHASVAFRGITGFGTGFTVNSNIYAAPSGMPSIISNGSTLQLTDNSRNDTSYPPPVGPVGNEATSAFYQTQQAIGNFTAQFTYQETNDGSPLSPADGFAFVLQNDSRGVNALGDTSQELGYGSSGSATAITPSAAVEFNIYQGRTVGTTYNTDGLAGADSGAATYNSTGNVNLDSSDPILIHLNYYGSTLTESLLDTVTNAAYTTSYTTDLTSVLGQGTGYVGFTGGDGGGVAVQKISGFTFTSGNASPAPEPSQTSLLALISIGLVGLILRARLQPSQR